MEFCLIGRVSDHAPTEFRSKYSCSFAETGEYKIRPYTQNPVDPVILSIFFNYFADILEIQGPGCY